MLENKNKEQSDNCLIIFTSVNSGELYVQIFTSSSLIAMKMRFRSLFH